MSVKPDKVLQKKKAGKASILYFPVPAEYETSFLSTLEEIQSTYDSGEFDIPFRYIEWLGKATKKGFATK